MEKNSPEWWQNQWASLPRINKAMAVKNKEKKHCRECGIPLERGEKTVCAFCMRDGSCP